MPRPPAHTPPEGVPDELAETPESGDVDVDRGSVNRLGAESSGVVPAAKSGEDDAPLLMIFLPNAMALERAPTADAVASVHLGFGEEAIAFADSVDILNIQVSSAGIRRMREVFATAQGLGLKTLIGTTQELSIGVSAQGHLGASVPNLDFPGDAAGAQLYLEDVVVDRVKYDNGHLVVPKGPGLGMELDQESLSKLGSRIWDILKK